MRVNPNTPGSLQQEGVESRASLSAVPSSHQTTEATSRRRRVPVIDRCVDVAAIEMARLEKDLTVSKLCGVAGVDPCAYRNLIRYEGRRSRESVIVAVTRALGLHLREVVKIKPIRREAA